MIDLYQCHDPANVGDNLALPIVRHFLGAARLVSSRAAGKLLAVGSIMSQLQPNDVVWGTGCISDTPVVSRENTFLAVRGAMTRNLIRNAFVPEIFGDPALLLPLMYSPRITKTHKIGFIPHYVDKPGFKINDKTSVVIDVNSPWRQFIDQVCSCESVVSSSLHGIVIAEAYGVPAEWAVYSNRVIGNGFKFRDYLTGTQREPRPPGPFPPIPDLAVIQRKLIAVLLDHFGTSNGHAPP